MKVEINSVGTMVVTPETEQECGLLYLWEKTFEEMVRERWTPNIVVDLSEYHD